MKTKKIYALAIFMVANLFFKGETIAQDLFLKEKQKDRTGFFVKQTEDKKIGTYLLNSNELNLILGQTYYTKAVYVEHLFEEKKSPVSQMTVKQNSGKNYIHCILENDTKNGILILERSVNGRDFSAVGFKDRIGSGIEQLCYYFTDTVPDCDEIFYRILAMSDDGLYSYSAIVNVINEQPVFQTEVRRILQ